MCKFADNYTEWQVESLKIGGTFNDNELKRGLQMPSPKACIKNYVLWRPHMNYAKTVFKLRKQILKFSGELHIYPD